VIQHLKMQLAEIQAKIEQIQTECSHPESVRTRVPGSDTGNWCRQDDEYWYDHTCGLCEKQWRTSQREERQ
jgi:hypothetical protein